MELRGHGLGAYRSRQRLWWTLSSAEDNQWSYMLSLVTFVFMLVMRWNLKDFSKIKLQECTLDQSRVISQMMPNENNALRHCGIWQWPKGLGTHADNSAGRVFLNDAVYESDSQRVTSPGLLFFGGMGGLFWEIHFNEKSEEVISMRSLSECPNMPTRHTGAEWSCWFCGRAPKATTGQRSAGQTFDPAAST